MVGVGPSNPWEACLTRLHRVLLADGSVTVVVAVPGVLRVPALNVGAVAGRLDLVAVVEPRIRWTPPELPYSFVSLLPEWGVGIEDISRLVGHSGTHVTELLCRHELRPVIQTGATAMDSLFATGTTEGE